MKIKMLRPFHIVCVEKRWRPNKMYYVGTIVGLIYYVIYALNLRGARIHVSDSFPTYTVGTAV